MIKLPYTIAYRVCKDPELSDLFRAEGQCHFCGYIYICTLLLILLTWWLMNMVKCICIEMTWRVNPENLCCLFQVRTAHLLPWSKFDCYFVSHRLSWLKVFVPFGCCFYLLCVLFLDWFMIIPISLHHIASLVQHWYSIMIKRCGLVLSS